MDEQPIGYQHWLDDQAQRVLCESHTTWRPVTSGLLQVLL